MIAEGVPAEAPAESATVTGPPEKAARDEDGAWSKAAAGFARKHGLTTAQAMELIRRIGNDRAKLNEAAVRLRRGLPPKPG